MDQLRLLKMITTIVILLQLSVPSLSYVKDSPISFYNMLTGYMPYINNNKGNAAWIYAAPTHTISSGYDRGVTVFYPLSHDDGTFSFVSAGYNYCIERYNNGLVQEKCDVQDSYQRWNLKKLPNGRFVIKLANSNLCISAQTTDIWVTGCQEDNAQYHWALIPPLSMSYELFTSNRHGRNPDNLNNLVTATWNMQGAGGGMDVNKWTSEIASIMRRGGFIDVSNREHGVDVLALQEAGLPPSATRAASVVQRVTRPGQIPNTNDVYENLLAGSSTRGTYNYVYFTYVGQSVRGSRVNLAIVSNRQADEVLLFPPMAGSVTARPILGIRIGNSYVFTIHAQSMGDGNDRNRNEAPRLIQAIEHHMATVLQVNALATWVTLGDFNRTPDNLENNISIQPPAGTHREIIYVQNGNQCAATQISGLALDYAVIGAASNNTNFLPSTGSYLVASALNHLSDHMAVRIRRRGM